jgi:hypothetical protein
VSDISRLMMIDFPGTILEPNAQGTPWLELRQ